MKVFRKQISVLLVLVMLLTAAPLSVFASNEDVTIDLSYEAPSAQDIMKQTTDYVSKDVSEDYYRAHRNEFRWQHADELSVRDNVGLRKLLQSTDPKDDYIALSGNCTRNSVKYKCEPIVITRSKVLDLNGYSIIMQDDSNKSNGSKTYSQTKKEEFHNSRLIEIEKGATLTIIDSSRWRDPEGKGTGSMRITARIINPFKHDIYHYTTRDLFWVNDGNLIIYGGTYQAGRQKDQVDSNFTWDKLKTVIGTAVSLGVSVAEYATGIDAATSLFKDTSSALSTALPNSPDNDNGEDDLITSTVKPRGENAVSEDLVDTPAGEKDRQQSVDEKQKTNYGSGSSNDANKSSSAKSDTDQDGKETKLAKARKDVTDAVVNEKGIGGMVGGVFKLIDGIAGMIGQNEKSRVTEVILGTCVHVGSTGTFVCYGGDFTGYGSTPHTRNAVIEVTQGDYNQKAGRYNGGLVYIYGGTFTARAGANVFNTTRANSLQTRKQTERDTDGTIKEVTVTLEPSETNNLEAFDFNGTEPVDTGNVQVRGGDFFCYYEYMMCAVGDDDNKHTKFPGTPGGVNLGVRSFGEDLIRDGRIQINDSYGDGALVLMDEHKGPDDEVYHYRLFCSDLELRYKRFLRVRPNEAKSNTTHSLSLRTKWTAKNADQATPWTSDKENDRTGAFNQTEKVFSFPLNSINTGNYYVIPELAATKSDGSDIDTSAVWYYNTPVSAKNDPLGGFAYGSWTMSGVKRTTGVREEFRQQNFNEEDWNILRSMCYDDTLTFRQESFNYLMNMKRFRYKVYLVDPLTRKNIGDPLVVIERGSRVDDLQCKLPLKALETYMKNKVSGYKGYRSGEMYRIELTVEETLCYDYSGARSDYSGKLPVATATSSILFRCYNIDELKDVGLPTKQDDYTALQWQVTPAAGEIARVEIVNGHAGKVDFNGDKIFDVYYQWYEVVPDGPDKLIAGTDNVYMGTEVGKETHTYEYWNVGKDGKTYVNTVNPADPLASTYGSNGLPKDQMQWNATMLHAYTHEMTTATGMLNIDPNKDSSIPNNNPYATGTDSCYIPKELAGKQIYCKAVVVNCTEAWQKEYDRLQTFYTHPVEVPRTFEPVTGEVRQQRDWSFISNQRPTTLLIKNLSGLEDDEYVTDVYYRAGGGMKHFSGLKVKQGEPLPTAKFPTDFYPDGKCPYRSVDTEAIVCTNLDRGPTQGVLGGKRGYALRGGSMIIDTEAESFAFPVSSLTFVSPNPGPTSTRVRTVPASPTKAPIYNEGTNFTATNAGVATLTRDGVLTLTGKPGECVITLDSPDGKKPQLTVTVQKNITAVAFSGLDAPEKGKPFDDSVVLPDDSCLKAEVYWTHGATGYRVKSDETPDEFSYYDAHVVLTADAFGRFPRYPVACAAELTKADGSAEKLEEKPYFYRHFSVNDAADRYECVYTFGAVKGANVGVIDKLYLTFPESVPEGTRIEDYLASITANCDVGYRENPVEASIAYDPGAKGVLNVLGWRELGDLQVLTRGVHSGFKARISTPAGTTITFGPNVEVIANGKPVETVTKREKYYTEVDLSGVLDLTEGMALGLRPDYDIADFQIAVGDSVRADDLLIDPSGTVSLIAQADEYSTNYEVDTAENAFVARKKSDWSYGTSFFMTASFDQNGDGQAEVLEPFSVSRYIYEKASEKPAVTPPETEDPRSGTATVKNANGSVFWSGAYTEGDRLELPEGSLVTGAETGAGEKVSFSARDGALYGFGQGNAVTVNTAPVNPGALTAGLTTLRIDPPERAVLYSLDGEIWSTQTYFTGLTSDTAYVLYCRQGLGTPVTVVPFRTARGEGYGVWVGRREATSADPGDLVRDGWHYDAASKTLTIKDLTLDTAGAVAKTYHLDGYDLYYDYAAIFAEDDLTLELVGNNKIVKRSSSDANNNACVRTNGNLTITGDGDLTLTENGAGYARGLSIGDKTVRLEGSGTLTFIDVRGFTGPPVNAPVVSYKNGDIVFRTRMTDGGRKDTLVDDKAITFDFTDAVHDLKFYQGEGTETAVTRDKWIDVATPGNGVESDWLRLEAQHTAEKRETKAACLVSGDCETGATYYMSCACGHIDRTRTFTAEPGQHQIMPYGGNAATCTEDGWSAYSVCLKCGWNNFEAIPALGHDWTVYAEQQPTCTEAGSPAYERCSRCGVSTKPKLDPDDPAWAKRPHSTVYVPGRAATCAEAGRAAHYKCETCSNIFLDEAGEYATAESLLAIPATGHIPETVPGKAASCTEAGRTDGVKCAVCGETLTAQETIPATGHKDDDRDGKCDVCGEAVTPPKPDGLRGDANLDGKVLANDARLVLRASAKLETLEGQGFINCDLNGDGKLLAGEARKILRYSAKLETEI